MITLYHCVDARSFRALWALEEVGAPYELRMLPFPPRYLQREYLKVNPLGTIPFMIDGHTRMTESSAICQYLADRYAGPPLAVRPEEPAYGTYLNALHCGEATLTFPQTVVLRYARLEKPERRLPQAAEDYVKWTLGRLAGFEALINGTDYVAAGRFTVADISVAYALMMLKVVGLYDSAPVSLTAYCERVRERPAFLRAKAAQTRAASEQSVAAAAIGTTTKA
jgi:glutathione S-transferase